MALKSTLIVDNYDSFTFNLVHLVESILDTDVSVYRNDQFAPGELLRFDNVILSPGPGLPSESAALMEIAKFALASGTKTLGVCLGHQALAEATESALKNLPQVHHGVSHPILFENDTCPLFRGIRHETEVGRYHSWVVDEAGISEDWLITSRDRQGEIMSIRHKKKPIFGIQFHPESILTPQGKTILANFLAL